MCEVSLIGKLVKKSSGKPFKSGDKIQIITEITTNPYSLKPAYKLADGSIVDCYRCVEVPFETIEGTVQHDPYGPWSDASPGWYLNDSYIYELFRKYKNKKIKVDITVIG